MLTVPSFADARVLVVGDVMLDRYWHGDTGRISPEAPVPVVRIQHAEERVGGAANVALNIAAVGGAATLLGVVGTDEPARLLKKLLKRERVQCEFVASPTRPTITKLRVISRHQQLIRLDFEEPLNEKGAFDERGFAARYSSQLKQARIVVLSDYAKGTLKQVPELIRRARAARRPILVDPKGRDFQPYAGATLLTPNLSELEAVVGACANERTLVERGENLRAQLKLEAMLITRSEQGMTLLRSRAAPLHLPAEAREVFDVTGAGDTVIGVLGAALAAGADMAEAAALANLAAGVVVGKLGTATVSLAELRRAARSRHQDERGVLDEATLLEHMQDARAHGETVVMTNGCFDLLHPGHVRYLQAARELGDWLVVAVNDDASVRRLKGTARPVNPLRHRMEVLAGLGSVDWVVPFSEDTPERVICKLKPDVLVKGGDYKAAEIAGYDCVVKNGGKVRILKFHDGFSTTGMLRRSKRAAPHKSRSR